MKVKAKHDRDILRREFEPEKKVLLYNLRLHLFPGKLRSRWTGPFVVKKIFSYGAVEIKDPKNGNIFKVNRHQLKPFLDNFELESKVIQLGDTNYAN